MSEQILIEANGVNGQLELLDNKIKIKRKGMLAFMNFGKAGDKEIFIKQITSIQFKDPGTVTSGYIQFAFSGGKESKGGLFDAARDENTIMFNKKQWPDFIKIKEAIEKKLQEINSSTSQTNTVDIPSQIKKLSELKDSGILTEDEFQVKKTDLLNRM